MVTALYSFACSKLDNVAFVGFRSKEEISRPYEVELFFTVPVGTAVKDAVGERAKLTISRGEDSVPVVFHGVIAEARLLHQTDERALYRALLVPKLWMLRHFWRSFIFTGKKVDEFLTDTLKAGGLSPSEFRFSVASTYPKEEFIAQYRETFLDFFHRWCEREGLYYYFEQHDDEPNEVLVIVDNFGLHEDFSGGGHVKYTPIMGDDVTAPPGLHSIEVDVRWLPKMVTIADYNYANPSASVKGDSDVTKTGIGTIREYGVRVFGESDAKRIATVRAESIGCRERTLRAAGTALGPRAGYRFSIDDGPGDLEESWLAVEVEQEGSLSGATPEVARMTGIKGSQTYKMKLFAVPASEQYRAPQSTPWPRIYGFENGVISGPADSPYAQIDADGRYLVRFEFDTSDLPDAQVSTRVRMLQPHGGSTEGFHFPLRKGTEVMVGFLGGDPDRPFIAGVVPNAHKPSVVKERNSTQNVIRTGSNNQIVMEDEQGKEFIFIQSPNKRTGIYLGHPTGDQSRIFTGDGEQPTSFYFTNPGAAATGDTNAGTEVGVSLWQTTDGNAGLVVGGDYWVNIWSTQNWFVYSPVTHGYLSTFKLDIGGDSNENYHSHRNTVITAGRTDKVMGGGMVQEIHGGLTQTIEPGGKSEVTGGWEHTVTAKNTDHYGTWVTNVDNGWTATIGQAISVTSTGSNIDIKAPAGNVDVKGLGGHVNLQGSASIDLTAPKVTVNGADVQVKSAKWFDWYSKKGAAGIFKMDEAAIYQCAYGVKGEVDGIKMEAVGIKIENEGCKKLTGGMFLRAYAMSKKTALFGLSDYAIGIWNGAFKKE
jgi:type VI secretion system secreted protein VgrG